MGRLENGPHSLPPDSTSPMLTYTLHSITLSASPCRVLPQPPSSARAILCPALQEAKAETLTGPLRPQRCYLCGLVQGQQMNYGWVLRAVGCHREVQGRSLGKASQPHPGQCQRSPAKIGSLQKRLALTAFSWSLVASREINPNYPQLQTLHCLA